MTSPREELINAMATKLVTTGGAFAASITALIATIILTNKRYILQDKEINDIDDLVCRKLVETAESLIDFFCR
jgi:hypothetical protein